jgi:4-amino-4-deoxy-L-arabinose transferase-like glycosyltransferase
MRSKGAAIALALGLAAIWLAFPGARDLFDPDEGRYAEIPREMLASGDWILPRLDGFVYLEKPPLQYWATATSFAVFGVGNAAARAWTILTGLLGVLFAWRFGRRLFGAETGAIAAILLASGLLWFGLGHLLTLDMGLSFFLFLAVGALAWAQTHRDEPDRLARWMLVAWAALALAMLSKGPVALVLAGGTVLFYGFLARDLAIWRHLRLGRGLLVLLVIAAPWFVAVEMRHPGAARFFFLHENFERYTTDVHKRVEPWWTYVPVVALGALPWIRPSLAAIVRPGFEARKGAFDPVQLLWTFVVLTVVFFSFSHSKLVPYVLPVCPPLALLGARRIAERPKLALDAALVLVLGATFAVLAFVPPAFDLSELPPDLLAKCRPYVLAAAAAFVLGGVAVLAGKLRGIRGVAVLGVASMIAFQALLLGYQEFAPVRSAREIARAIDANVPKDAPVFSFARYDQPLPFYLGRTVEVVAYHGELRYGQALAPEREIPDVDAFLQRWTGVEQAAAVMTEDEYELLRSRGFPMRRVHSDPRRVVVVRR